MSQYMGWVCSSFHSLFVERVRSGEPQIRLHSIVGSSPEPPKVRLVM